RSASGERQSIDADLQQRLRKRPSLGGIAIPSAVATDLQRVARSRPGCPSAHASASAAKRNRGDLLRCRFRDKARPVSVAPPRRDKSLEAGKPLVVTINGRRQDCQRIGGNGL